MSVDKSILPQVKKTECRCGFCFRSCLPPHWYQSRWSSSNWHEKRNCLFKIFRLWLLFSSGQSLVPWPSRPWATTSAPICWFLICLGKIHLVSSLQHCLLLGLRDCLSLSWVNDHHVTIVLKSNTPSLKSVSAIHTNIHNCLCICVVDWCWYFSERWKFTNWNF